MCTTTVPPTLPFIYKTVFLFPGSLYHNDHPSSEVPVVVNIQTSTQFPPSTYHPMFRQNVAGSSVPDYFGPPAPVYGVQAASSTVAKNDDEPLVENIV